MSTVPTLTVLTIAAATVLAKMGKAKIRKTCGVKHPFKMIECGRLYGHRSNHQAYANGQVICIWSKSGEDDTLGT